MKRLAKEEEEEDSEFDFEEGAQKVAKISEEDPEAAARLFMSMPMDALNTIAMFLPLWTILNLCSVNRTFYEWCHRRGNNGLWTIIYQRNFGETMPLASLQTLLKTVVPAYDYTDAKHLLMAMAIFDNMSSRLHGYLINSERTAVLAVFSSFSLSVRSLGVAAIDLRGSDNLKSRSASRAIYRMLLPYMPKETTTSFRLLDSSWRGRLSVLNDLERIRVETTVFSPSLFGNTLYFVAYLHVAMVYAGFRYSTTEEYDWEAQELREVGSARRLPVRAQLPSHVQCGQCRRVEADAGPCEHCVDFDRRSYCGECYGHHQLQH